MAEQLAVDDVRGHRLAVERQQRALGAKAGGVNRAGDSLLAGSGLADDQHRQPVARGFCGDRHCSAELRRGTNQLLELEWRRELLGDRGKLARRAAAVGIGCKRLQQPLRRHRMHQKIGGSGAHGLDRNGDIVPLRHDDDREVGTIFAQRGNHLWALFGIPTAEQRRLHFPAVRPLEQGKGHLLVRGTDDAPAGATGNGGDQSALLGICIQQQ